MLVCYQPGALFVSFPSSCCSLFLLYSAFASCLAVSLCCLQVAQQQMVAREMLEHTHTHIYIISLFIVGVTHLGMCDDPAAGAELSLSLYLGIGFPLPLKLLVVSVCDSL
jgi:hypothetical protein